MKEFFKIACKWFYSLNHVYKWLVAGHFKLMHTQHPSLIKVNVNVNIQL